MKDYKKAKGSKGISNPTAGPPKAGVSKKSPKGIDPAGLMDSRPGSRDNKQSART